MSQLKFILRKFSAASTNDEVAISVAEKMVRYKEDDLVECIEEVCFQESIVEIHFEAKLNLIPFRFRSSRASTGTQLDFNVTFLFTILLLHSLSFRT